MPGFVPSISTLRTTASLAPSVGKELRVLAFNAAKVGFHRGGLDFAPVAEVRAAVTELHWPRAGSPAPAPR